MARGDELNIPTPGMASTSPSYRVPRRKSGLESNTKRMALVAGGLAAGLGVLMGVWSLSTPRKGGLPVVQADSRPLRVKPENAGGMQVDGNDATILSGNNNDAAKLAPPPEAPDVAALKKKAQAAADAAKASADEAAAAKAHAAAQQAAAAAPKPAAPATPSALAKVETAPAPAVPAPAPVKVAMPAQPAPAPVAKAPVAPVASKPAAPAGTGKAQVQLAAVTSEEAAMGEWRRLEKRMPDLLGGRKPAVSKVERDGKTLWRVRTGGFADSGEATQFCEKVRSKGAGCTVASF